MSIKLSKVGLWNLAKTQLSGVVFFLSKVHAESFKDIIASFRTYKASKLKKKSLFQIRILDYKRVIKEAVQ